MFAALPLSQPSLSQLFWQGLALQIVERREIWVPTLAGWGVILLGILLNMVFMVGIVAVHLYSCLAVNKPISAEVLVVEGWMPEYALEQVLVEFRKNGYQTLITTGGPLPDGHPLTQYKTFANLAAATLIRLGLEASQIKVVPSPYVSHGRTKASALAFQQWLTEALPVAKSINLYSFGSHARRSWLAYRRHLHPNVKLGIIASTVRGIDPQGWWKSSDGIKDVICETIALLTEWIM